jgi:hypothetical protein
MSHIKNVIIAMSLALLFSMPQLSLASSSGVVLEEPTAMAMTGDLLIARPVSLAVTVVGVAVFLVSLPFSLLGGNVAEAGKTLVVGPATTTFVRCLGCTQNGYKSTVDHDEDDSEDKD